MRALASSIYAVSGRINSTCFRWSCRSDTQPRWDHGPKGGLGGVGELELVGGFAVVGSGIVGVGIVVLRFVIRFLKYTIGSRLGSH